MQKRKKKSFDTNQIVRKRLLQLVIPIFLLFSPFKVPVNAYYKVEDHLNLILQASFDNAYLEQIGRIPGSGVADTTFDQLYKFGKMETVQACNKMFQYQISRTKWRRRRKAYPLAVDWTDIPYYGKAKHLWIVKGKAKAGTIYFHRYLTISVVKSKYRFILLIHPMRRSERKADKLSKLLIHFLTKARKLVRFHSVYFDRGFFASEIIRGLDAFRPKITYIMAAPRNKKIKRLTKKVEDYYKGRGRFPSTVEQIRVTRRRIHCKAPHLGYNFPTYLLGIHKYPVRLKIWKDWCTTKRGKRYLRDFVYCTNSDRSPEAIHHAYKARFGIETSYRDLGMMRANTRSNQPQVRFFFFGVACVLYNAWVATNLNILSPQKHPRKTSPVTSLDKTDSPYSPPLPLFDFITLLLGHYTRVDFFIYRKKGPPWVKDDKRLTRVKKSPLSPLNFLVLTYNV